MLGFSNVTAGYGNLVALHDIGFEVQDGERVAVLGHNGAGKTTLLRCAMGAVPGFSGEIRYNGRPIDRGRVSRNVRSGLAFVQQGHNVFPNLTVAENLEFGSYVRGPGELERVFELFPLLRERRQQRAGLLSGGQQQMLALGMALMSKPSFLLLDEPTTGLAPVIVKNVFEALRRVNETTGVAMMVVEQNVQAALAFAPRAIVIKSGRMLFDGASSDLLTRKGLWDLF